jgi:hypothetical protein
VCYRYTIITRPHIKSFEENSGCHRDLRDLNSPYALSGLKGIRTPNHLAASQKRSQLRHKPISTDGEIRTRDHLIESQSPSTARGRLHISFFFLPYKSPAMILRTVDRGGFEPPFLLCRSNVIPLYQQPIKHYNLINPLLIIARNAPAFPRASSNAL